MKLGVGETSYCFDTSALVSLDANYKQSKVFGALWHDIEELMAQGRFVVIDMLYDEVMRHEGSGSSWLKERLKRNKKDCFRDTDEEAMVMARKVIRENKNTGFISEQKMMAGKEEADPYLIGHAYGPYALERADALVRLSTALKAFVEALEKRVGAGRLSLVLTADHGVTPIPEDAAALRIPSGRVRAEQVGAVVDGVLDRAVAPRDWVKLVSPPHVWLDAPPRLCWRTAGLSGHNPLARFKLGLSTDIIYRDCIDHPHPPER